MKWILTIPLYFCFALILKGQYDKELELESHYTANIMQLSTGSGHSAATSINGFVQTGRKSLGVGLLVHHNNGKVGGLDIRYRIYTGLVDDYSYYSKVCRPFVQYNLLYRKVEAKSAPTLNLGNQTYEVESQQVRVATMEHYIMTGLQYRIQKRLFLDISAGAGLYIGAINPEAARKKPGFHHENHGYSFSVKGGIGYRLN